MGYLPLTHGEAVYITDQILQPFPLFKWMYCHFPKLGGHPPHCVVLWYLPKDGAQLQEVGG